MLAQYRVHDPRHPPELLHRQHRRRLRSRPIAACFLGDNEYGTWQSPLGLQQPELSNLRGPARRQHRRAACSRWARSPRVRPSAFVTMLTQQEGKPRREPGARAKALFAAVRQPRGRRDAALAAMSARLGRLPRPGAGEHARREHEQHAQRAQSAAVLHDQELVARSVAVSARLRRPRHRLSRQLARRDGRACRPCPARRAS